MTMKTNLPCSWCNQDGYFGDFGPGLYPLPCPHCAGIGLEGIISEEVSDRVINIRKGCYGLISEKTKRLEIAATLFSKSISLLTVKTPLELIQCKREIYQLRQALDTFPQDYHPIESECLKQGWISVAPLVEPVYLHFVTENSQKVVGKTYLENAHLEIENYHLRNMSNKPEA